ncbi:MAG: HlyD family efflux transporter periplasmic adaptor subunit [Kiritimatiellales bacterium]|nr:HlyD family efflux transporter periplasmic adaptor subunit [Kiritimatiellales bacterium]
MKVKKTINWILFLAVVGGGGYYYYHSRLKQQADDKPSYDRAAAERRDLRVIVESTGEIQPRNRLDVKPPIAGRLEELLLDEGDAVDKGQLIGWVSSTERATLLDAALATSKEEFNYWQELYKPTPLISPLKGTIIARNFEPGQSINANDAVVVIADDLIVVASLDETDIGQVKIGQKVNVRLESYPDTEFACVVEKIAYDARTVSNVTMYEVDVDPDKLPAFARSGMTANLEFVIEEKLGVLAVPASAVQEKGGGSKGSAKGASVPDSDRRKMMMDRMREKGMSDAEIQERLAQFAQGGGRPGGDKSAKGGKRSGGEGKAGGGGAFVLVDSGDPVNPAERPVKKGISDGSYTEITEGLEDGEEVLIAKIKIKGKTSSSGSPFMSTRGPGKGGGGR